MVQRVEKGRATREKGLTAYQAAKQVNAALKEIGLSKRIPTQMMYNYTHAKVKDGKRPIIEYTTATGIDEEDFRRWLSLYLDKQMGVNAET